jgi:threonine dehydrogenase-like Zn-dependent dehydrogenase
MEQVRAAVMVGPGRIEIEEFPLPDPEPGAVLMRVSLSGICGTDKHTFRGETSQYPGTEHAREISFPLICGHENVGVVASVGGSVLDSVGRPLRVGDRIVPGANIACGECYFCRNGFRYYLCERLEDYGNSLSCARAPHLFGGWAEYMYLLPGTRIFTVPDDVPDEVAVLTEVMAVTHGLDSAVSILRTAGGPGFAHSVALIGLGPLGLCHLIKARIQGASELIAIDRLPGRLGSATTFGATLGIDAGTSTFEERRRTVFDRTGGRGADVVVDCSGVSATLPEALRLVRPGGVVVEAGAFVDVGTVNVNPAADLCTRDVTVIGVGGERAEDYPASLAMMAAHAGWIPFDRVVTHRRRIEDAADAVELSQRPEAMKVVIDPGMTEG